MCGRRWWSCRSPGTAQKKDPRAPGLRSQAIDLLEDPTSPGELAGPLAMNWVKSRFLRNSVLVGQDSVEFLDDASPVGPYLPAPGVAARGASPAAPAGKLPDAEVVEADVLDRPLISSTSVTASTRPPANCRCPRS